MAYRPLEITIISAEGLKRVKHLSKMDVYVIASVSSDLCTQQITPTAKQGGTSPKWNSPMKFSINESASPIITFKLRCKRHIRSDKEISEVHVPVKELLSSVNGDSDSTKYVTYPVKKPSGKLKGELNFLFKFGNKVNTNMESPVTAYPATMHPYTADYYPPEGYPQDGSGYGYPPPPPTVVKPQSPQNNAVLEAAFVEGVLGGLLVAEMVSEAAAHDGHYDAAGFQDYSDDDYVDQP